MTMDLQTVAAALSNSVPMVKTLGLEYLECTPERVVMRLNDQPDYQNHLAAPHAGAMFTLGESCSGAIVISELGEQMGRGTPLVESVTIRYLKIARGDITATATMSRTTAEIVAELDADQRPSWTVDIVLQDPDGTVTGEMDVKWTIKPHRRKS